MMMMMGFAEKAKMGRREREGGSERCLLMCVCSRYLGLGFGLVTVICFLFNLFYCTWTHLVKLQFYPSWHFNG